MTRPAYSTGHEARARDVRVALVGVVGFAAALAAASHVAFPARGAPVPLTLQPLVVVLAGLWLGPAYGAASMLLYIAAGAIGLPTFAPTGAPGMARLLGPTGGYILAYPVAASTAGWLAARADRFGCTLAAAVAGVALIHVGGLAQLAGFTGSASAALTLGVKPFLALDAAEALVAAWLAPKRSARARG
jgi:biotin transport system substrate-specific component